jgi:hypothetical protein
VTKSSIKVYSRDRLSCQGSYHARALVGVLQALHVGQIPHLSRSRSYKKYKCNKQGASMKTAPKTTGITIEK